MASGKPGAVHPEVVAYAKNDHLGFHISYLWQGSRRRYLPDFIVRLHNGLSLALEIKGEDTPQNRAKRAALSEWTEAVNGHGGFGVWACDVAFKPAEVIDIVLKHANRPVPCRLDQPATASAPGAE